MIYRPFLASSDESRKSIPRLTTIFLGAGWTLMFLLSPTEFCVCHSEELQPTELIARLKEAEARLKEGGYAHYRVTARVKRELRNAETYSYTYEFLSNNNNQKSVIESLDDSQPNRIEVASPGVSFSAKRSPGSQTYKLGYLSSRDGVGYEDAIKAIRNQTPFARGPHDYLGTSLLDVLSWKTSNTRSIKQMIDKNRPIMRVTFRRSRETSRQEHDYMDCVVDLDPALDLAIIKGENNAYKDGRYLFGQFFDVTYSLHDGLPLVESARFALKNADGIVNKTTVEVLSRDFAPILPEEFSLASAGITGVSRNRGHVLPRLFFISISITIGGVVLLIILRRKGYTTIQ